MKDASSLKVSHVSGKPLQSGFSPDPLDMGGGGDLSMRGDKLLMGGHTCRGGLTFIDYIIN